MEDASRDRSREAERRRVANGEEIRVPLRHGSGAARRGEHEVTVEGGVRRHHRPRDPIVGRDRHPLRLRLRETSIRRHGGDDGVRRRRERIVLSAKRRLDTGRPVGEPRSSELGPSSNGAAQNCRPPGTVTEPTGLAATRAPTMTPFPRSRDADPRPPLRLPVVAPAPAPAVPSAKSRPASLNARRPRPRYGFSVQSLSPPFRRSKRIAAGTIGTRTAPTAKPRPAAARASITPDAASSPKAEPPESTSASTLSTSRSGASRSVSRVPGAPPMTCTAATNGSSAVNTVVPDLSPRPPRSRRGTPRRR